MPGRIEQNVRDKVYVALQLDLGQSVLISKLKIIFLLHGLRGCECRFFGQGYTLKQQRRKEWN